MTIDKFNDYFQPFLVGDLVRFAGKDYRVIGIEKAPFNPLQLLCLFMNLKESEIDKLDSLDKLLIFVYINKDGSIIDDEYDNIISSGIELIDRPYHNLSDMTCRYYCKFKEDSDLAVDMSFCKECKYFQTTNISASSLFFIGDEVMNLKAFTSKENIGITNITAISVDPSIYRKVFGENNKGELRETIKALKKIFTTDIETYLANLHYKINLSLYYRKRLGLRLRLRRGFTYDFDTDRSIKGLCNSCIFTTCDKCVYSQFSNKLKGYLTKLTNNKF